MPSRSALAVLAAALVGGGAVGGAALSGQDAAPSGQERSREALVAERGARVMPFSLDATTHVFDATRTGGVQRVVAHDPRDARQIGLIRGHLRKEAAAFRRGDFGDPASIHGESMPGLATLEAGYERIDVIYRDRADGAQITYRTGDRALAGAVGDWFAAQLRDHGADATSGGGPSPSEHEAHQG